MKSKNKMALISGFMPALCMGAMLILKYFALQQKGLWLIVLWQVLPFLLPCIVLGIVGAKTKNSVMPRFADPPRRSMRFVITMSLSASLLSLLINCLIAAISGYSYYQTVNYSSDINGSTALALLLMVVLPAFFEEIFFRGVLVSGLSSGGTGAAIFVTALSFALCHGDIYNFAGPLAAGLIYGFMAYALDSVWPAVIAHLINNAISLLIANITKAYDLLGLWDYFLIIMAALFFIFTFMAMSMLETLIEKGKVKRFVRAQSKSDVPDIIFTPGLLILAAIFIIHIFTEV